MMYMMKNAVTVQNVNLYLIETKTDKVCRITTTCLSVELYLLMPYCDYSTYVLLTISVVQMEQLVQCVFLSVWTVTLQLTTKVVITFNELRDFCSQLMSC